MATVQIFCACRNQSGALISMMNAFAGWRRCRLNRPYWLIYFCEGSFSGSDICNCPDMKLRSPEALLTLYP